MPSAKDLRDELRSLRKEHVKPISKLRVADIASEIQRLKGHREETPAVAAVPSVPHKMYKSAVESIKEAQASEFPTKPVQSNLKGGGKGGAGKVTKPPKDVVSDAVAKKKAKLAKLLAALDSDEDS